MPYKVLEKFVGILLLNQKPGRVDYFTRILNEPFALGRYVVHVDRRVVDDVSQSFVDLGIGGKLSIPEGLDDAV